MENVEHFGTLTERMKEFREEVLDEKPYIDAQRAILATLAYKENLNQPRVMVRAKMLEKVLDNMSIYIEDKSLLAGNQAKKGKSDAAAIDRETSQGLTALKKAMNE